MNHKITKTDDLWIFLLDSHTNFKSKYFQSLQKKRKKQLLFIRLLEQLTAVLVTQKPRVNTASIMGHVGVMFAMLEFIRLVCCIIYIKPFFAQVQKHLNQAEIIFSYFNFNFKFGISFTHFSNYKCNYFNCALTQGDGKPATAMFQKLV